MSDTNLGGEASILEERRKKLEELREQNIAYINDYVPTHHSKELHDSYDHLSKEDLEAKKINNLSLAGRIVLKRVMGNASFVTIRDGSGDIQAYITKNNIDPDLYKNFFIGFFNQPFVDAFALHIILTPKNQVINVAYKFA